MSIKDIARMRIMEMVNKVKPANEWKILVLDHHTTRIANAAISMHEITEHGVTCVEDLMRNREPFRKYEAIYFISPLEESVDKVISDFQDKSNAKYAAAHLFFSSPCPDALFNKIAKSPVSAYLKNFVEQNLEFLAVESKVFSLDKPLSLYKSFSGNASDQSAYFDKLALQLATVMSTIADNPYVCYTTNNPRNEDFAKKVQAHIDAMVKDGAITCAGARGQLLITDRSMDMVTPALHDLHYQPMVYDLLPVKDDVYDFQGSKMILGESDFLWSDFRHLHIGECSSKWTDEYSRFQSEANVKKINQKEKVTLKDLQEVMRAAPQFKEKSMRFQLHLELIERALKEFDARDLDPVANLEQDMAVGETADGQRLKNALPNLIPILQDGKIKSDDKLRLLMVFVVSRQGVSSSDLQKLYDAAGLSAEDRAAVDNLSALDVAVTSDQKRSAKDFPRRKRNADGVFASARYVPVVKDLMEGLIDGKMDKAFLAYTRDAPAKGAISSASMQPVSARSKPGWASKKEDKKLKTPGSEASLGGARTTVFMIGGITYAEMAAAYEVSDAAKRPCYIGSTQLLTATDFLRNMRVFKKSEADAAKELYPTDHYVM